MNKREFKDRVYAELARAVKALANPHRLEIMDLLAQGPFPVEQIADSTGLSVANASQHLQQLKNAKLVRTNRQGNFVNYSLASEQVCEALACVRELGRSCNAEVEKTVRDFRNAQAANMRAIDIGTLARMLEKDEVVLLDVRSETEYNRGHIHRALSAPVAELGDFLKHFPRGKILVAYCWGPFCAYADEAVAMLAQEGYNAARLDAGFPEWVMKGYPVERTEKLAGAHA